MNDPLKKKHWKICWFWPTLSTWCCIFEGMVVGVALLVCGAGSAWGCKNIHSFGVQQKLGIAETDPNSLPFFKSKWALTFFFWISGKSATITSLILPGISNKSYWFLVRINWHSFNLTNRHVQCIESNIWKILEALSVFWSVNYFPDYSSSQPIFIFSGFPGFY